MPDTLRFIVEKDGRLSEVEFATVEEATEAIASGSVVVAVDDDGQG